LVEQGYLGPSAGTGSKANLGYFTTCYRQGIVFDQMKRIVREYLELWYV